MKIMSLRAGLCSVIKVGACAALISGCTSMPYVAPELSWPAQWTTGGPGQPSAGMHEQWWTRWRDPRLDHLVGLALAQNIDLRVGMLRVREARVRAQTAAVALEPSVSAQTGASQSRTLRTGETSKGQSYSLGFGYELDLWNRLSDQRAAQEYEAQAVELDQATLRLSLVATVLRTYWQIGYTQQLIANQERSIAYARRNVDFVKVQQRFGAASVLEMSEAQVTLTSAEARRISLQQSLVESRNALALLVASPLGAPLELPQGLPSNAPPPVEPGLPAELLSRRPDLRAAELRLRGLHANNQASVKSFYPSISLSGDLGGSSTSLRQALQNPVMSLAGSVGLAAMRRGDYQRAVETGKLQKEQAELQFRDTLLRARSRGATSHSARPNMALQSVLAHPVREAPPVGERLTAVRYRAGAVPLRTWLDAQEALRQAENAWADNQLSLNNSQVAVVQALGGDPVVVTPAPSPSSAR